MAEVFLAQDSEEWQRRYLGISRHQDISCIAILESLACED